MPTVGQRSSSPFSIALGALDDLLCFARLCWAGLGYAGAATEVHDILSELHDDKAHAPMSAEEAQTLERFAAQQLPAGFPYLYGLAALRLWTILEVFAEHLLLEVFKERLEVRSEPEVQKLRGPLVEFASASDEEQAELLLNLLIDQLGAGMKKGVGRFEAVFQVIGLGGPVDDHIRRVLLELSEVRHVLVHRNGIADRKFLNTCPWFPATLGESIRLSHVHFARYLNAISWYVFEVSRRDIVKYPPAVEAASPQMLEDAKVKSLSRLKALEAA